ncbi:flagellar basal body rod protein FlgB [Caulobacter sp. 17J65-9]|uniref:flagellar basal body rod protein FlgB n=1 Tax=Caulobacter sp. 17J65-9 TaxID=2709382 RepID=UPI0013C6BA21|nr:flagellar basal body rod protein FlgB [Caulobacter sp. 17J65-9]NEX94591.1 flagellar basal body rod protein FlgB [Caulobacter sp. 17J65-9]
MRLDDIPLFSMLKGRLGYLNERQRLVSENVANADTPGYVPRDLKAYSFSAALAKETGGASLAGAGEGGLAMTQAGHMTTESRPMRNSPVLSRDSETTLDGNAVVLEEQMVKMAESRMAYDAAIGFYQKSMNMLRMAARAPGR